MNHGKVAITMLTTAHELYKKGSQQANRLMYHIGALLARERLACEDVESAQKLLESVAGMNSNTCVTRAQRAGGAWRWWGGRRGGFGEAY